MSDALPGLLIILDGLGDRPVAALAGQTPLEAAHTPVLDQLAARGMCGQVDPLIPGFPVGTHTGTGVLMGISNRDVGLLPRGPVEAAGIGMDVHPGDVVLRCNLAHLEDDGGVLTVIDRRAGRIASETDALCEAVSRLDPGDGVEVQMRPARQHRAVLRLRGHGLTPCVSDTDPGDALVHEPVAMSHALAVGDIGGERTAATLNRLTRMVYEALCAHPVNLRRLARDKAPANGIIARGAGSILEIRHLIGHLGLSAAVVSGGSAVTGLGRLMNFDVINRPEFTGNCATDLAAKVAAAETALASHDMVFLHIKAPDICAHDRDPQGKKDILEKIDAALAGFLDRQIVLAVTGDHSTDSNSGGHCGDPVPALLCSPQGRRDRSMSFGEMSCMHGGLGRIASSTFLISMLDAMGRLCNYQPGDRFICDPCPR